ncbi:MAG: F0F1 ATP synthase subunit epsilon [Nitrospinae bacterium]|nr:F0F1 ATP synthase subunit epsilon [Nitrospinota bacterium]
MASTVKIDVVTPERGIYSGEVEFVVIPGTMGELGVYPKHAPLLTTLQTGELRMKLPEGKEESIFVSGGFCEILPDQITVLGDVAERADEIDEERAQAAAHRAEELMKAPTEKVDLSTAEASIRKSSIRLKIAQKRKKKR